MFSFGSPSYNQLKMNKQRATLRLLRFARAIGYYRVLALWYRLNNRILASLGDPLHTGALAMLNADRINVPVGQHSEIHRIEYSDWAPIEAKAEPRIWPINYIRLNYPSLSNVLYVFQHQEEAAANFLIAIQKVSPPRAAATRKNQRSPHPHHRRNQNKDTLSSAAHRALRHIGKTHPRHPNPYLRPHHNHR